MKNFKFLISNCFSNCLRQSKFQIILFVLLILFSIFYSLSSIHPVSAADSTPSATKPASQSGTLLDKINAIKEQVASKAAQRKNEVKKQLENKALIGIIFSKDDTQILISTPNGNMTVKINEYTNYQNETAPALKKGVKAKVFTLNDLQKDDFIVALGDMDDKSQLNAKKVIKTEKFEPKPADFAWGQIQSVLGRTIGLKTKNNQKQTVVITSKTTFFLGNEESSILDAKSDKFMIAKGTKDKEGTLQADYIYLIPGAGFIKPEKTASTTPSASIIKK